MPAQPAVVLSGSILLKKHNALGRNCLLCANRTHAFPGLGLQPDSGLVGAEQFGNPFADGRAMRKDFGPLGEDDAIQIPELPAGGSYVIQSDGQHFG